jgi:hypothetical protein
LKAVGRVDEAEVVFRRVLADLGALTDDANPATFWVAITEYNLALLLLEQA